MFRAFQGLDDDTPGTSVVEWEYTFEWNAGKFGRFGLGPSGGMVAPEYAYHTQYGLVEYWMELMGNSDMSDGSAWSDPTALWSYGRRATVGYFPATGDLGAGEGAFWDVSAYGYVWSSSRYPVAYPQYVSFLYFYATDVIPSNNASRASAFAVRCVQEELRKNRPEGRS